METLGARLNNGIHPPVWTDETGLLCGLYSTDLSAVRTNAFHIFTVLSAPRLQSMQELGRDAGTCQAAVPEEIQELGRDAGTFLAAIPEDMKKLGRDAGTCPAAIQEDMQEPAELLSRRSRRRGN